MDVVAAEVPADQVAAEVLGVELGASVLSSSRRFLVEGRSIQILQSLLPRDVVGGTQVAYADVGPGGTYARLAELGHAPVRFTERVIARAPRPEKVERLDLGTSVDTLVIEITRVAFTETGGLRRGEPDNFGPDRVRAGVQLFHVGVALLDLEPPAHP